MKIALALATVILAGSQAYARIANLEDMRSAALEQLSAGAAPRWERPAPVPPARTGIAVYETDEEFNFESEARPALDARLETLRAAGITVLGGRVLRKPDNDYTFAIDYIPTVKHGAQVPPAVIVASYRSGGVYWREDDAVEAMNAAAANLSNAGLPVLSSYLTAAGRDHSFAVDFVQANLLRPTQEYDVQFLWYEGGKFTFESEAEAAVPDFAGRLAAAGVTVIRGKAVKRPDRDYSVRLEYVVRTNRYGPRPRFAVARYDAAEVYSFEDQASKASAERMDAFNRAGAPAVHGFARKAGRDYSFSVDYLVKNLYQHGGGVVPSVSVKAYRAPETYTFESEAEKAMAEKAAAFESAGFSVVGSRVVKAGRDYSYALDYLERAAPSGNPPPAGW